jgi:hypothetical protein
VIERITPFSLGAESPFTSAEPAPEGGGPGSAAFAVNAHIIINTITTLNTLIDFAAFDSIFSPFDLLGTPAIGGPSGMRAKPPNGTVPLHCFGITTIIQDGIISVYK